MVFLELWMQVDEEKKQPTKDQGKGTKKIAAEMVQHYQ